MILILHLPVCDWYRRFFLITITEIQIMCKVEKQNFDPMIFITLLSNDFPWRIYLRSFAMRKQRSEKTNRSCSYRALSLLVTQNNLGNIYRFQNECSKVLRMYKYVAIVYKSIACVYDMKRYPKKGVSLASEIRYEKVQWTWINVYDRLLIIEIWINLPKHVKISMLLWIFLRNETIVVHLF
jgi:hypothetical protein